MHSKRGTSSPQRQCTHQDQRVNTRRRKYRSSAGIINEYGTKKSSFGLTKFADLYRESFERQQDIADALDDLLLRGEPPQIYLTDYVPADWLPMFRVLRDGLKFSDEATVMTVMAGVPAMLPPQVRIRGRSMEEIPTVWVFHIGTSGTAKRADGQAHRVYRWME